MSELVIGDIAILALVLFYWPTNPRHNLYCSAADPAWRCRCLPNLVGLFPDRSDEKEEVSTGNFYQLYGLGGP